MVDWISLIPAVAAGFLAGTGLALASFWKHKYDRLLIQMREKKIVVASPWPPNPDSADHTCRFTTLLAGMQGGYNSIGPLSGVWYSRCDCGKTIRLVTVGES